MAVTIYDIARKVGKSNCTVSRALNDHPRIGAKTKDRILEAAKDLGYRPAHFARGLTSGKTRLIGVVIPDFRNPFYTDFLRAVEIDCSARGYSAIPMEYRLDNSRQRECLEKMLEFRCEGVITFFQQAELFRDLIEDFWEMQIPCIQTIGYITGKRMDRVYFKLADGVKKAVKHLAELGHRKIVLVDSEERRNSDSEGKLGCFGDAFKSAMLKCGFDYSTDDIVYSREKHLLADGLAIAEMLIQSRPDATAAIARNDFLAMAILRKMLEHGRRVPEDFSIIGTDNTWLAESSAVPLTSIDTNLPRLVEATTEIMFSRIEMDQWDDGREIPVDVGLQVRRSTGPCTI